jgi:hypothetical protein
MKKSVAWISFCDPSRPKGSRFVGACLVVVPRTLDDKQDIIRAIRIAWAAGCNPGGDAAVQFSPDSVAVGSGLLTPAGECGPLGKKWVGRLLTGEQCAELDGILKPHGVN